ncbi:hypothetical protein N1851_025867 [Merluccius polli]|uniref:Uncharacterized protein n=1 Tax=Merluccius polli TaxID=89951 RepID=A0AA47MD60_MERPO|nr:hypothetical protein N1851_025867 [Merluccius polli]
MVGTLLLPSPSDIVHPQTCRILRKSHLSSNILVNRCTIESILTNCITVWYGNCSVSDRKAIQRVVKTAQCIAGASLPAIEDIYKKRCLKRATNTTRDSYHPAHRLFALLPSGRRYRSLRTRTSRFRNSFFLTAVSLLNSAPRRPSPPSLHPLRK